MTICWGSAVTVTAGVDPACDGDANGSWEPAGIGTSRKPTSAIPGAAAENGSTAGECRRAFSAFLADGGGATVGGVKPVDTAAGLLPRMSFRKLGASYASTAARRRQSTPTMIF